MAAFVPSMPLFGRHKLSQGYPDNNTRFQAPNRALLFQNGH